VTSREKLLEELKPFIDDFCDFVDSGVGGNELPPLAATAPSFVEFMHQLLFTNPALRDWYESHALSEFQG
jgi:hypothetical protein